MTYVATGPASPLAPPPRGRATHHRILLSDNRLRFTRPWPHPSPGTPRRPPSCNATFFSLRQKILLRHTPPAMLPCARFRAPPSPGAASGRNPRGKLGLGTPHWIEAPGGRSDEGCFRMDEAVGGRYPCAEPPGSHQRLSRSFALPHPPQGAILKQPLGLVLPARGATSPPASQKETNPAGLALFPGVPNPSFPRPNMRARRAQDSHKDSTGSTARAWRDS